MVSPSAVRAGTAPYTKLTLKAYDLWVVHLSNTYAWRCDRTHLVDLYNSHMGLRHLDVGPGTGWAVASAQRPPNGEIALLDLNPNCVAHTESRIGQCSTLIQSVFEPLPTSAGPFDSIALNYVLHCIPGNPAEKASVLGNLASALHPEGVLFGSTILGDTQHNLFGSALMHVYNRVGAFHNWADSKERLETGLEQHFNAVDVRVVGNVALFTASEPKNPRTSQE